MKLINTGINCKGVDVYTTDVDYEKKMKKDNHRTRKIGKYDGVQLPCLECGNAAVVFQFVLTEQLLQDMEFWWEYEYMQKGENFNVELYTDTSSHLIELRYMSDKCYYTSTKKRHNSIQYCIEESVLEIYETLPREFQDVIELCYVSDFDYLEYGEEK